MGTSFEKLAFRNPSDWSFSEEEICPRNFGLLGIKNSATTLHWLDIENFKIQGVTLVCYFLFGKQKIMAVLG